MLRRLGFEKVTFDKKYPLFVDIFTDETTRRNMLANEDLSRKYEANNQVIKTFIFELNKRFDIETVRKIVSDTVLKLPDNLLVSFVTAYLNSDEATKSNSDVVSFFNKTLNLGNNCINYIEENGIVANRKYKELPQVIVDNKYKELRSDNYTYPVKDGVETLDSVFEELTIPEKEFVIDLLEHDSFKHIKPIFDRFSFGLKSIIRVLKEKGVTSKLLNDKVIEHVNYYYMTVFICYLLEMENSNEVMIRINHLVDTERFDLINSLIVNDQLVKITQFSIDEIDSLSTESIMIKLQPTDLGLKKVEA